MAAAPPAPQGFRLTSDPAHWPWSHLMAPDSTPEILTTLISSPIIDIESAADDPMTQSNHFHSIIITFIS